MNINRFFGITLSLTFLMAPVLGFEIKNPALKAQLLQASPWIVLSLVSESEQQASITPNGEARRKQLEQNIQALGAEILPLSMAERMKLERMWSIPYSGRFSDEIKSSANTLHASIISGSFPTHSPEKVQLILWNLKEQKNLVFYEILSKTNEQDNSETTNTENVQDSTGFTWVSFAENLEPSRQPPEEKGRRHSNLNEVQEKRMLKLKERLDHNPVLLRYQQENANKSDVEIKKLRDEFFIKANNSFMTSSKIELLSRAHILNQSLSIPDNAIESKILEQLISHEDFFGD